MKRQIIAPPSRQQGATLIIALVFLVLLTLLGVTVASNNSLQERMAGNTRQRDLAFQAAEFALKTADGVINNAASSERLYISAIIAGTTPPTKPDDLLLNGESHANDADYWKNTFDWTTTASTQATGISSGLLAANPRYLIEQLPSATCPDDALKTCYYYRATAHGVGKSADAVVILQAMYKFE